MELPGQLLDGSVGLVHHGVEGVLDQGYPVLRQSHLFLLSGLLVVELYPHVGRVPLLHLAHPHGLDVHFAGRFIQLHVYRHHGDDALVQHGQEHIEPHPPSGLVDVG